MVRIETSLMRSGATVSNGRGTANQDRRRLADRPDTRFFIGGSKLTTRAAVTAGRTVSHRGDVMSTCCQDCTFACYRSDGVDLSSNSLRAHRASPLAGFRKSWKGSYSGGPRRT
jgi:hypothetical protein